MLPTLSSTTTTIRLSGTRTRLSTAERESSGMYFERSVPMSGKCIPQHTSKSKNEPKTRSGSVVITGTTSAAAARKYTQRAMLSAVTRRPTIPPKSSDPIMTETMNAAKMYPNGSARASASLMPRCSVGVQTKTKQYMALSKSDWIAPSERILKSWRHAATPVYSDASHWLLFSCPKFSDHVNVTMTAPATKNSSASPNGATNPNASTTTLAATPDRIATSPLPHVAHENVCETRSAGKPRRLCSQTIHDSKTEKSSDVATPATTRPNRSTAKTGESFVTHETPYSTAYSTARRFLPIVSATAPITVPKMALERNPTTKSSAIASVS
eukprot:Unigene4113_Nuclearia_a/m.12527 Unigene4113_Nuclearia_a/g.12527  ORF Unigene4113_Nuclearia_a/g.12527 Unigene4113_Nuclearia_a/m.12527 type:complete len:327 (-) Unigene4113_Nuclearia_a:227-1207(-)